MRSSASGGSGVPRLGPGQGELIDRVKKLRILVSAFAQETAAARREAARLRSQNAKLQRHVLELETRLHIALELSSQDP